MGALKQQGLSRRELDGSKIQLDHLAKRIERFSLFPSGVLQVRDVLENSATGTPEGLAYLSGALPRLLELLRLPGDLVFIFLGALPILLAVRLT
jgi:hypothetical protein